LGTVCFCFFGLKGQLREIKAHEYASKTAQFGYYFSKYGEGIQVDLSLYNKIGNTNRMSISFDIGEFEEPSSSFRVLKADYAHLYTVNINDFIYWNIGGGGFVSVEHISDDILEKSKTKFSPGINAMIELELFYGRVGVFVLGEQRYRPMSIIGDWYWRAGFGLKYVF